MISARFIFITKATAATLASGLLLGGCYLPYPDYPAYYYPPVPATYTQREFALPAQGASGTAAASSAQQNQFAVPAPNVDYSTVYTTTPYPAYPAAYPAYPAYPYPYAAYPAYPAYPAYYGYGYGYGYPSVSIGFGYWGGGGCCWGRGYGYHGGGGGWHGGGGGWHGGGGGNWQGGGGWHGGGHNR